MIRVVIYAIDLQRPKQRISLKQQHSNNLDCLEQSQALSVHSDTYDEPTIERYYSQCYSYVILPFIRMSIDYALIGVMRDHNQDRSRLIITLDGRGKDQMSKLSSFIV
jgi:hypothetical protein